MRIFKALLAATLLLAPGQTVDAQSYGLETRPPFTAFRGGVFPGVAPTFSGNWTAVVAFPNLTFLNPMGIIPVPGTNKLAVWEREGRVYIFENNPATSVKTLILDVSNRCQGWDDSGMAGIAFHPDFVNNRELYVYYTWVTPGTVQGSSTARPPTNLPNRDRLARFTCDAAGIVNSAETVLIDQVSTSVWHNGGGLFFHPDNGFLYLTNGDDANGGNSQRIDHGLHSGVIRIDVDQLGGNISHPIPRQPLPAGSVTANYYIPNDNPFVGQPGVLEEFFALGLRSPHRMTVDPVSKRIFIGDVGAGSREEITAIEPADATGLNLQWDRIEGSGGDLTGTYIGVNKRPILDYGRTDGRAVIGGYVYRGAEFASDLYGKYIFGDNITNTVWYLDESTSPPTKRAICTLPRGDGPNPGSDYLGLSSFGHDQNNELYMCQLSSTGGRIFKFSRSGPAAVSLPQTLSSTGLFSNLATLAPATGFLEYSVNSPFWSDGARKKRWFAIPTNTTIGYAPSGEWTFPQGSMWLKHFDLPVNLGNPAITRRLETRVLVRDTAGYVYGASYKWLPDLSDAVLVPTGTSEDITIAAPVVVANYISTDIGGSAAGSTTDLGNGHQLVGGGADIWGTSDQFRFAHESVTGDFDVVRRVESLTQADLYTKAGLMARESVSADSRHVFALVFPSNAARNNNVGGYEFQSRDVTGGTSTAIYPPLPQPLVNYPDTWLRLKREGNVFTAYSGTDGVTWSLFATKSLTLSPTLRVGLAVTSHNPSITATASFRTLQDRVQSWYFPGRSDCLQCHTQASGGVLGMKSRQNNLDRLFPETATTDNQLRAWNHIGLFSPTISEPSIPGLLRSVPLDHPTASLEDKARSYVDSNCSGCHRPGGVNSFWDGRLDTPLASSGIIDGTVQNILGVPGSKVVVANDVPRSIMHRRMNTATEPYKMPPLGKNVVDDAGVAAISSWISSLTTNPAAGLPVPWVHSDVGPVNLAGDANYSNGNFNLTASGEDIWLAADGFHFIYQTLTGDGEITAHVSNLNGADPWSKAGVMIRESLTAGSPHGMTVLTTGQGAHFQARLSPNADSIGTYGPSVSIPYWVRIKREGNLISSYISDIGDTWALVGSEVIPMAQQVYIGMCLTSHNNSQLSTATIDSVNVTGGVAGVSVDVNFQLAGAPVPPGYLEDSGANFGTRGNGFSYGWNQDNSGNHRDRNFAGSPDQRYDTLTHLQKSGGPWIWEIAMPNGRYRVRTVSGDPSSSDGRHHLTVEGVTLYDAPQPGGNNTYLDATADVLVNDGRITVAAGPNGTNTKLNFIEIDPILSDISIALTSPVNNTTYLSPANITLQADAIATTGSVALVEFFNGPTKLGQDTTQPYSFVWSGAPVGNHTLTAKATNSNGSVAVSAIVNVIVDSPGSNGLVGEYFANTRNFSGVPIVRQDATINFNWAQGSPMAGIGANDFNVRWSGRVQAITTGNYVFTTTTDDGARLRVGGVLVIDQWVDQGPTPANSPAIPLVAGQFYDIEMDYYEGGGGAFASLAWTPPGQASQIIPNARLSPPVTGNRPPRAPFVVQPGTEGQLVHPEDVRMEVTTFSDPNPGDTHVSSDWEIWTVSPPQRVWVTANIGGMEKLQTHLADGVFETSHLGRVALRYSTDYQLRVRFRDSSAEPATEWGAFAVRNFRTTSYTDPIPGAPGWIVNQPNYKVEILAQNLQLPVNIAFVSNPGPAPTDVLCYVTELYGTIKMITRNGTVSNYATGLLNFNPTGNFPGTGEQGLTGLTIDPASGDLFAAMLYSSIAGNEAAPHYPKVVRFHSTDGGRTAATQTTILNMTGETQGQSHQVSNLTIGPDNHLYLHMGDGFDSNTAQNLDSYRGKVLRFTFNGAPLADNPFYSAANGINARDYVFAYGLRNPFGGDWRTSDASHFEVENGPSVDRICKIVAGRNYLWNGSDASMSNFAIWNWNPAVGPVNMAFIQTSRFGGSGFPAGKMDHMFISESGPTWGTGPQANGKRISEFVINSAGARVSGPTPLIEYNGTGKATVVGLTAGPDGLYFTDFYKDQGYTAPIDRGSNLLRVRYAPPIPWNFWQVAQFTPAQLEDPLISGAMADPDLDGIVNLLEYGMGLPPLLNSQANLPVMSRVGDVVTMIYRKNTDASDVTLNLQVSTNLTNWGSNGVVEAVTGTVNGIQTVEATYTVPAGTEDLFMRVRCVK